MSNEHTSMFHLRPDMTLAQMLTALLDHFERSDTDHAEFEFDGKEGSGQRVKLAFAIKLVKVQ